ncbi:MAG: dTDP-4-amino-4,6-dideoxygalactose transaminase [Elusimicrobia bacterium]|nr:dTDP-4-amino-4,6-dideoxygalactose transaminase [Elusimicrobiota bacterium]
MKVPFNKPAVLGREFRYIRDAVRRGQLSGDGYYTGRCSRLLEDRLGARRVLLTPSCTHALELAGLLLDLKRGDEVILPTFTFPSTANAFVLRGAVPRLVDIRPDTLNMDERLLEGALSPRSRAVCPVHYAGVPCRMDLICRWASRRGLAVVEDAAQALGASCAGRPAAAWGSLNALSFHETKNCACGEGGALVITEPSLVERAEIMRQKGTDRAQFLRGMVDKYSWVDVGSSYVPSELQAAYLLAQLERLSSVLKTRRRLFDTYRRALSRHQASGRLQLPSIPAGSRSSYHLFHILLEDERDRDRVMAGLQKRGILAIFHYVPLHLSKMGRRFGYRPGQFPVAESASGRLLRLPMYNAMSEREQGAVIRTLEALL